MRGGIFKKSDARGKAHAISRTPSGEQRKQWPEMPRCKNDRNLDGIAFVTEPELDREWPV